MKIHEIAKEFQSTEQGWFHFGIEHEMFNEALQCFAEKRYVLSASVGVVLFERIFTTRLIRETSSPTGFVPSESNVQEQLTNLLESERKVVDGDNPDRKRGMSFHEITDELRQLKILCKEEKDEYDDLYKDYRIPVTHGLSLRLFENVFNRKPSHPFEPDVKSEEMYKKVSELIINEIYDLVSGGKFLKK
ncbi:MAG: hypothetical protein KAR83_02735 [Thermodesulfovibrionales bacterium]|nr:hypothetical protein [Thermodesulfovibrionales bacterium]